MPSSVEEVLTRGVEQILPSKKGLADLIRKRKIRLYLGIDPTNPDIHLGHTIPLRKLKQFQDLGHEVILLIGTFTAQIGDPSARTEKRKALTSAQITKNMATYRKQASKILDFKKAKIKYNGDWLAKLSFEDLAELASHFTVPQLLERDMFQERMEKGKEIWINEFLYPLMQGYDSVAMNVDLEIGATDQTFNMLVGRKLQKIYNNKEKFVLTTPILAGLDGRKMSKTYGNTINLTDSPKEMYFKIMQLKDELITQYFELCTEVPLSTVKQMERNVKSGKTNPMDVKKELAAAIVKLYHGKDAAEKARKAFEKEIQKGAPPNYILTATGSLTTPIKLIDLLMEVADKLQVPSRSAARRMIVQGGVEVDGLKKGDPSELISPKDGIVIRYGKKDYVRLKIPR